MATGNPARSGSPYRFDRGAETACRRENSGLPASGRSPGSSGPLRVFRSSDGSLWIGTLQGLLHLHQGKIDRFRPTVSRATSYLAFLKIAKAVSGSARQDGLDRFREFAAPTISVNQGLSNAAVHVLEATPDGSIWIATADGLNRWQNGHVTVYGRRSVPGQNGRTDERDAHYQREGDGNREQRTSKHGLCRLGRMIGDDCGLGGSEGVFYFDGGRFVLVPGVPAEIYSQSPGMGTGRFGSATSTRAFSIRRRRVQFSAFLGPDSDTSMRRRFAA